MATLNELVDEVYGSLSGYGVQNDPVTWLTGDVNAVSGSTTLTVYSTESAGRGVVEVGDELMWVDSFDQVSNTMLVAPFGRGYRNSGVAAHKSGDRVVFNPSFTRKAIKTALNDTILAMFPKVKAVSNYTFDFSPAVSTYALPSLVDEILSVTFRAIGPAKEWVKVRGWRRDGAADAAEFSSSTTVTLLSAVDPGAKVKVVYSAEPALLEDGSDDFATTTGLPESCKDVVVLGATYRLLSTVDPARIQFASPESELQSGRISAGSAISAAKYLYALYQARLQEESDKQNTKIVPVVHYTN